MATIKDATVLILDVGRNASERESDTGPTFFEEAKKCIEAIITRKLFTKTQDEMSLLLLGVQSTDNELYEKQNGGYEHISHGFPMKTVNWEMLNYLNRSLDPPNADIEGDWIDAIFVAMDYLRTLDIPKTNRKIILFTNFSAKVSASNIDSVVNGLEQEVIELIVITTNVIYEMDDFKKNENATFNQMLQKTKSREKGESMIKLILSESNGVLCSFEEAMAKLVFLDKRNKRRVPWNADLMIGSNFSIKIAAFIFVRNENELNAWKTRAPDSDSLCRTKKVYYHNDEELQILEETMEELIKGYSYGGTAVAFEDTEEFENGGKGLRFIGVTNVACIREEYMAGTGIWLVGPQKGSKTASSLLTALSKALHKLNFALIARYTYSNKSAPKIMTLFPNTNVDSSECEHNSLLMFELFFKDNFVEIVFPPLQSKKTDPTQDEIDVIDKFIDAMDLSGMKTSNESNTEATSSAFFKKLLDPGLQQTFHTIAHRALNPHEPLLKPNKDVLNMIRSPKEIKTKPIVDRMKSLFPLEIVKKTKKEFFFDRIRALMPTIDDDTNMSREDIKEVGTIDPAEDFIELLDRGERFDILATQIQNAILQIVTKSVELIAEKVIKGIFTYREFAKQKAPYNFNEWIANLKKILDQQGKLDLWTQLVVDERLGLITANESELSTVSEADAQKFMFVKSTNAGTSTIIDDNDNNDNIFDEL